MPWSAPAAPNRTGAADRAIVPLTVVILALLFIIQRKGTFWIGGIFAPIMLVWFVVAGVLGIMGIATTPEVLAALSSLPAITYLWHAGPLAFVVIGGAFLAITGGEAFHADMGHFGPLPIRLRDVLDRLGVAPAILVAHSWAGGLALSFALDFPERTAGLVLVAPATHPDN